MVTSLVLPKYYFSIYLIINSYYLLFIIKKLIKYVRLIYLKPKIIYVNKNIISNILKLKGMKFIKNLFFFFLSSLLYLNIFKRILQLLYIIY